MADGINRLSGYGNYGVGGYFPQHKQGTKAGEETSQETTVRAPETQLDPTKVMDFLSNNSVFVNSAENKSAVNVDPATQERVVNSMERFELIYATVVEEFGEEIAPTVMDMIMDRLMGMTK